MWVTVQGLCKVNCICYNLCRRAYFAQCSEGIKRAVNLSSYINYSTNQTTSTKVSEPDLDGMALYKSCDYYNTVQMYGAVIH